MGHPCGCDGSKSWTLAVLAVEEVLHGGAAFGGHGSALFGSGVVAGGRIGGLGGAALGTAIGETGLIGLQLELFRTDDADFDRECHCSFMIRGSWVRYKVSWRTALDEYFSLIAESESRFSCLA